MKARLIGYWATTLLIALAFLSGGVAYLAHQKDTVEGMAHLGYPAYVLTLLGIWKLLGGIALVIPRSPRLKEWAYAGIFFDLTGATWSHAAVGDELRHIVVPLVLAAILAASWALRPPSRVLGAITAGNPA